MELLRLYDMDDEDRVLAYYAKGHIDREAFAEEVGDYRDEDCDPLRVQHLYLRWLPTGEAQLLTMPARGATPITYLGL